MGCVRGMDGSSKTNLAYYHGVGRNPDFGAVLGSKKRVPRGRPGGAIAHHNIDQCVSWIPLFAMIGFESGFSAQRVSIISAELIASQGTRIKRNSFPAERTDRPIKNMFVKNRTAHGPNLSRHRQ